MMASTFAAQFGKFAATNRYKYNDKEYISDSKLYDYGARHYDPLSGRWWVVDPLAEKNNGITGYAYANNNPLLFIDPIGLDTFRITNNSIIITLDVKTSHTYIFTNSRGTEKNLGTYQVNENGLINFSSNGDGFGRYGDVQKSGNYGGEEVGNGDHYLTPDAAAALFGVVNTLNDENGFYIQLGDMSTSNGSDPAWMNNGEDQHHRGHGHKSNRSGLDVDFRYLDYSGKSFQSNNAPADARFSVQNNSFLYETARRFGFNLYFQGTNGASIGGTRVGGHNNHGHLGYGIRPVVIRPIKK
jgi:RHS repeat-associated protein